MVDDVNKQENLFNDVKGDNDEESIKETDENDSADEDNEDNVEEDVSDVKVEGIEAGSTETSDNAEESRYSSKLSSSQTRRMFSLASSLKVVR